MDGHCEESSSKVPATCKEGCLCQPGYLLNNDKCVLQIQCGCRDAQGDLIPVSRCGKKGIGGVAKEMAHWVKCLPYKCEGLSLNLQNLCKLDVVAPSFYWKRVG